VEILRKYAEAFVFLLNRTKMADTLVEDLHAFLHTHISILIR